MLRHMCWAEPRAISPTENGSKTPPGDILLFLMKSLQGTEASEHRDTFIGETYVNMVTAMLCQQQCWTHTLEGAKRGQRAFTGT